MQKMIIQTAGLHFGGEFWAEGEVVLSNLLINCLKNVSMDKVIVYYSESHYLLGINGERMSVFPCKSGCKQMLWYKVSGFSTMDSSHTVSY